MTFLDSLLLGFDRIVSLLTDWGGGDKETLLWGILVLFTVGMIVGVFGYKLLRMLTGISSAFLFGMLSWTIMATIGVNSDLINYLTVIVAIGGGFFGFFLYQAGFFLQGFLFAFCLMLFVFKFFGNSLDNILLFLALGISVLTGWFTVAYKKVIVIVINSFIGALMIAFGIRETIVRYSRGNINRIDQLRNDQAWLISMESVLIVALSITFIFFIIQFRLSKKVTLSKKQI
jgi:hypothetical protein